MDSWTLANRRYLTLEVERVRLLARRAIARQRVHLPDARAEELQGLVVSDALCDRLLRHSSETVEPEGTTPIDLAIALQTRAIHGQIEEMREAGGDPALIVLARMFGLGSLECDLLLVCLAPELDPAFATIYGFVHRDAQRPYPSLEIGAALLAPSEELRLRLREVLLPRAPLRRFRLLYADPAPRVGASFAALPLRLDERVAVFLQGFNAGEERVGDLLEILPAAKLSGEDERQASELAACATRAPERGDCLRAINLIGPNKAKAALAVAASARLGLRVARVNLARLAGAGDARELMTLIERECYIRQLALLIDVEVDLALERSAQGVARELVEHVTASIWIASADRFVCARAPAVFRPHPSDPQSATAVWESALGEAAPRMNGAIEAMAQHFDFGPDAIQRIIASASARHGDDLVELTAAELWTACRNHAAAPIEALGTRLEGEHGWDDLILPASVLRQLRDLTAQVRHRGLVYETWGFADRQRRGRGITALFSGPSGVGKTMAAEVIGNELDLSVVRVDLAGVVSKYIGETEKNLRRVFDVAEQSGAVLFFDEADALFAKRTDVKESRDRYANIEVNYLLQKMEEYRGLAILATNRKGAIDPAFLRRIRFWLEFPAPDYAARRSIWQRAFVRATLAGLDLDALARLELNGGSIRNVALNAAFLAANDGRVITMGHVLEATRREYSKLERVFNAHELREPRKAQA